VSVTTEELISALLLAACPNWQEPKSLSIITVWWDIPFSDLFTLKCDQGLL
jgi:hypothetical protein